MKHIFIYTATILTLSLVTGLGTFATENADKEALPALAFSAINAGYRDSTGA